MILYVFLKVIDFSRDRAVTNDGSLSVLVDQNVIGVDVPYFLLQYFKFIPCPYQIVEYIPNLCLVEILVETVSVFYLTAQYEFKFVKC
jgi:hypothetical protein